MNAPEPLTTVHLVRHGEVYNPEGVLYERLPGYHLSELGLAMAQRVADYFSRVLASQVGYLVASPLERAQETAVPIGAALGLEVATDARLIEAGSSFAGTVVDAAHLVRPKALVQLRNPRKPSWGEPYIEIAQRMTAAIAEARVKVPGGHVVAVSHQSPIWRARLYAEGRPLWHFPTGRLCSLASITSLVFGAESGVLQAVRYYEPAGDLLPDHLR
ncbi:MAG: histidine phosphatase family protein [Bifidobacteriaceae bacterium]|jgi:broad specificity phosphatase PhoE|nr:histidine phosphatase family protein [Bifidobacteriaceae bacterium]